MRIAIDIRCLTDERYTGINFYTLNLVHEIAKLAPHDDIMLFASGSRNTLRKLPIIKYPNVEVVEILIPNRILFGLLKLPLGPTLEAFLPRKPDVWIFPKTNIVKTKLPYTFTAHDLSFSIYPKFFTAKNHLFNKIAETRDLVLHAAHVFAVSKSTAHDLETLWSTPPEKITVTRLGVNHERFVPREQPSDRTFRATYDLNRPYFLSLATREPRKNLESVIEGYDAYRARGGKAYPLILIGGRGWKMGHLRKILSKAMHKDDIRLLGYVPEKHKPALFRGAAVFLFPSFYEGFGLPVLEAMACGVPVITSFTSALTELVKDAGLLVDPFNVNDITSALHILFDEPGSEQLRAKFAHKGLAYAQEYTWDKTAELTLKTLRTLV